jgi:hypothetical protein
MPSPRALFLLAAALSASASARSSLRADAPAAPPRRLGELSDCGSPAFAFSSMAIFPDPPVPGAAASLNASGTLSAAVTGGNVSVSVLYLGLNLFSSSAWTCGNTTIELPLGAGEIDVWGFQDCPAATNSVQTINMTVTLPTITPPGDYQARARVRACACACARACANALPLTLPRSLLCPLRS